MVSLTPSSKLKLYVECRGLRDKDTFSKSDPICIVMGKDRAGHAVELGRTEQIQNNLNPRFTTPIPLEYFFEERQDLEFLIYDIDDPRASLDKQDFLGSFATTLGSVVGARGSCLTSALSGSKGANEKKYGSIKILAEEIPSNADDILKLRLGAKKAATKDWFGKGDHYLVLKRTRKDGQLEEVHKTEVVKNSADPTWAAMEVRVGALCLGDLDGSPVVIEMYDWNAHSAPDFIGQAAVTVRQLLGTLKEFKVEKPKSKTPNKDRGALVVVAAELVHPPTFVDFIAGGCEIAVAVAVDFTASNKKPTDPLSLHFRHPTAWNSYQSAIIAVGEILDKYSRTKAFDAYGFGGKLPNGQISHCFELTLQPGRPTVAGVGGILEAYDRSIQTVELWGPTNFADIIRAATHAATGAAAAAAQRGGQAYRVLLIITDGEISDMDPTKDAIVDASFAPLSIIIVGVGGADFSRMRELDGDEAVITSSRGSRCQRDIVQFVSFDAFRGNTDALRREVLAEVPRQLVSYMAAHSLRPLARPQAAADWDAGLPPPSAAPANSFQPNPAAPYAPAAPTAPYAAPASNPWGAPPAAAPAPQPVYPSAGYGSIASAPPAAAMAYASAPSAPSAPLAPSAPPPPPSAAPALPPGWRVASDPSSGRAYYVHDQRQVTQWEWPTA